MLTFVFSTWKYIYLNAIVFFIIVVLLKLPRPRYYPFFIIILCGVQHESIFIIKRRLVFEKYGFIIFLKHYNYFSFSCNFSSWNLKFSSIRPPYANHMIFLIVSWFVSLLFTYKSWSLLFLFQTSIWNSLIWLFQFRSHVKANGKYT